MAKKSAGKSRGVAAIEVIEDDQPEAHEDLSHGENGSRADSDQRGARPGRKTKVAAEPHSGGNVGIGDIKKAAAFANSVGGLDKAISLLQILKVAKEMQ